MARKAAGEVITLDTAREQNLPSSSAPTAETPSLRDYLSILSKRRWVFVSFFLATVLGVGVWVWNQPRIYHAACSLEISPTISKPLGNTVQDVAESGASMYWQSKEFSETQYQIIRSRAVSQRVVDRLGLATDEDFLGLTAIKDPKKRHELMLQSDPVATLQSMILVEPVKDSRVVRVAIEGTNPARAMQLANALADAYIEANLDRRLDTTKAASLWLADQLDGLKGKLESSEVKLHDFKRENDILTASIEDRQSIVSQRLLAFSDALTRVSVRKAELDARRRTLEDARAKVAKGDVDGLSSVPVVAQNSAVAALRTQLLALEEEKAMLEQRYLDKHPKLAEVEGKIAEVRRAMDKEIGRVVGVQEREYEETVDTMRQLQGLISGAKRETF
jgi:succinoglycan biosynthesis transport protein ExoP